MQLIRLAVLAAVLLTLCPVAFPADSTDETVATASNESPAEVSERLALPSSEGPLIVRTEFFLQEIGEIDDEAETFEFTGILVTQWTDPRLTFDPVDAGCQEKIFQGEFQFNELSPIWYPQIVLVNESGVYDRQAVVLRIKPNGQNTLIEKISAVAETEMNLVSFPFDQQILEARFEILGFDSSEVRMEIGGSGLGHNRIKVPQWTLSETQIMTAEESKTLAGLGGRSSQLILNLKVARDPLFMLRLVILPLVLIVVLSWSVFWMDRSSLGDRINVSFIGILTVVAYQVVVSDIMPQISYITWMNAFLNVSFCIMCLTVVINLLVGEADKKGEMQRGDRMDRRCRWLFPLVYFGLLLVTIPIAYLLSTTH